MDDIKKAEQMLYKFTRLLRKVLPKANNMITLEEEIDNIKNYVELQKIRYYDCFEVNYDIDSSIYDFKLPSLILQPIVENAIFYSMEKENNKGLINVVGYRVDDAIIITIKDNGVGMSKDNLSYVLKKEYSLNRVGVVNVHERVQLYYGEDYGLKIDSIEGEGTTVTFILPNKMER